jgi:hypothetical protein
MYRIRCIAEGGFKTNNGPSTKDKGPMTNKEDQESSNKASQPQPTQAGRIETCMELIVQAMKCLENNDKECIMRKIEELVKADCHNGNAVGKEITNRVKEFVHGMWLRDRDNDDYRCELLTILRGLGASKRWVRDTLGMSARKLDKWFIKCSIDWENKAVRYEVVKEIEGLLREKFGWDEIRMCEEMWRFVGVDVDEFRKYGVEPCVWLEGLESLRDLRNPYWLGIKSDMAIRRYAKRVELVLGTTNTIDAVFFPVLLSTIKTPGLIIVWKEGALTTKYVHKPISLDYYIILSIKTWPWPELSADELEKILNSLSDEELVEFIAGLLDGDGMVWYDGHAFMAITACKACPKRMVLGILRDIIARRLGIVGRIESRETADVLMFRGKNAVKLLRRIVNYVHHPLRRLRAELILALYDGRISPEDFEELYEMTKYEQGEPDIKRNHGLEALIRAAPQTHTHGGS